MVDLLTNTDEIIEIIVGIFALFLFALSISAYRTIQLKKMIFAIAAFGLFAVESFIDYLEDVVPILDTPYIDILLAIISLDNTNIILFSIYKKEINISNPINLFILF